MSRHTVVNFGGNIHFKPSWIYAPISEAEVLQILDQHAHGKIRVAGALHAWSPAVVSTDALVDLRHFNSVELEARADGSVTVVVGAGCRIKHLLRKLHRLGNVTLPSIGLITEQTIAGAIATATHGSGKQSLSHFVAGLRVAAYDPLTGKARIYDWNDGPFLKAARCSLGAMGIVLSVKMRCVPKYAVEETMVACRDLDEVLAAENDYPLQQFFLVPHRWTYFAQRRRPAPALGKKRSWLAKVYRAYWFLGIDLGLHVIIKSLVSVLQRPALTRFFFRHLLSNLVLKNVTVVDDAVRMLVMEHELFKHLEIEIFVPARHVRGAAAFVRTTVEWFAGTNVAAADHGFVSETKAILEQYGLLEGLAEKRGSFTQHYPITFRRVLPDEALISMTSGADEPYYAISFITYVEPRDQFLDLANFLARAMTALFEAKLHWGKYFPLAGKDIEAFYPRLPEFRELCRQVDPKGVFRNEFVDRILFARCDSI